MSRWQRDYLRSPLGSIRRSPHASAARPRRSWRTPWRENDLHAMSDLIRAVAQISDRLEPAQAARVWGEISRTLTDALGRQPNPSSRASLAYYALDEQVADRLDPGVASRIRGQAASTLIDELERETNPVSNSRGWLAEFLESVTSRMEPGEAARIRGQAARLLISHMAWLRSTDVFSLYNSPTAEQLLPCRVG